MVTGVVLAGGRGVRMGGGKPATPLAGRPLIQWSVDALQQVVRHIVIAVAPGQRLPILRSRARITVCEDVLPGLGPLTGIFTGLHCAESGHIIAVPCDAPLVAPAMLRLLISRRDRAEAVIPEVAGRMETAFGVYARSCVPALVDALNSQDLSVRSLLARLDVDIVSEEELRSTDAELRSFVNVNTPAELLALQRTMTELSG